MKTSDTIKNFLNLLTGIEGIYNCYVSEIKRQDKITQDLLHTIELGNISTGERYKLSTRLKENRLDRRYYKDRLEEIEPLYTYFCNNRKIIKDLQLVLGHVRKAENYHEKRFYIPKVLIELPIIKNN